MNSPKFLLVDIGLFVAAIAAAATEQATTPAAGSSACGVDVVSADPQRMVIVIEGEKLPQSDRVRDAISLLCADPAAMAMHREERGWEVFYLPPEPRGN